MRNLNASTLRETRKDAETLEAIRAGGWDFVVLSGHPSFGKTLVIDGEVRVGDPSEFIHHGRLLVEEIRRAGARAVLLLPPPRPGAPVTDQQVVDWAYHRLAKEAGALVAPVSDAFSRARRQRPDLSLFDPHGARWSSAGAALAAAVLEATMTGRPPTPVAPTAALAAGSDLAPEARIILDEAAWEAVHDLAADGGSRRLLLPPFPSAPTLPRGDAVTPADLRGSWSGPLRLYPWPATLELTIVPAAEGLRVTGRVRFDNSQQDLDFSGTDVRFEQHELSFGNPADLAEGRTLFRLVSRADRLTGVAELVTESNTAYAIGGFDLTRIRPEQTTAHPGR